MRVAITGSSGLVGRALRKELEIHGHEVLRVVREARGKPDEVYWDIEGEVIDLEGLQGVDGIVHLAGESIVGWWTDAKKRRIRRSRVDGTRLLARTLAELDPRPSVLVSASAVGYYGDRGAERLDEASPPGEGFLAEVCVEWEAAAGAARDAGIRVVHPRIGLVLSSEGGVLPKMLVPFRLGLGGKVGSGEQFVSWIVRHDLVGALRHFLETPDVRGPVNAVTEAPVRNAELTRILGDVVHRPTLVPLPAFVAKTIGGEMADELLLASTRVDGGRLLGTGFEPRFPELEGALRFLLDHPASP